MSNKKSSPHSELSPVRNFTVSKRGGDIFARLEARRKKWVKLLELLNSRVISEGSISAVCMHACPSLHEWAIGVTRVEEIWGLGSVSWTAVPCVGSLDQS